MNIKVEIPYKDHPLHKLSWVNNIMPPHYILVKWLRKIDVVDILVNSF